MAIRIFFECHEVLEEYWKEIAPGDKMHPLVGYVQLATGLYHWRRGNDTGAIRILEKALYNFQQNEDHIFFHEISYYQLLTEIKKLSCRDSNRQVLSCIPAPPFT
ncbi:DUF309 domain-containing protein [Lysinibacillus sp. MHQ-1]|nr:DUF309 domain-containing protein [Lysinibacillus sp. MHQ-1]